MGGRGNYLLHSIGLQDDFSRIINVSNLYRAPNGPIVIARWTGFVARCRLSREQLIFTCQRRLADEPRRVLIRRKGPMRATSKIPSVRVCALIRSSPTRKKRETDSPRRSALSCFNFHPTKMSLRPSRPRLRSILFQRITIKPHSLITNLPFVHFSFKNCDSRWYDVRTIKRSHGNRVNVAHTFDSVQRFAYTGLF